MKTLVLIRHAKAEQSIPGGTDFERNLTDKGKENALEMASNLHKKGIKPDLIISSSAKRASKTAAIFAEKFSIEKSQILKKDFLYRNYGVKEIKKLLMEEAKKLNTVFIFGHNPTISWLAASLVSGFSQNLPTSGVVIIDFNTDDWSEIGQLQGELLMVERPTVNA